MIRLIATDLDNTLLEKDGSLPESTIALLVESIRRGATVAVSTGRSFASAKGIADQFLSRLPAGAADSGEDAAGSEAAASPETAPGAASGKDAAGAQSSLAICYNGAQIRDLATGEALFSSAMPEDLFYGVIEFAHENDLYIQMYDNDEIIVETLDLSRHPDPDLAFAKYREVGDLAGYSYFPTPKILLATDPSLVPEKQDLLEKTFEGRLFCAQSASHLIEVMNAGINKGAALDTLRARLGITREETMALGDNTNDSHLLKASGLAVSVANGVPELKAIADYVCEKERSAGVEEALRKFVLVG